MEPLGKHGWVRLVQETSIVTIEHSLKRSQEKGNLEFLTLVFVYVFKKSFCTLKY